jgi:hypothetical protein
LLCKWGCWYPLSPHTSIFFSRLKALYLILNQTHLGRGEVQEVRAQSSEEIPEGSEKSPEKRLQSPEKRPEKRLQSP